MRNLMRLRKNRRGKVCEEGKDSVISRQGEEDSINYCDFCTVKCENPGCGLVPRLGNVSNSEKGKRERELLKRRRYVQF